MVKGSNDYFYPSEIRPDVYGTDDNLHSLSSEESAHSTQDSDIVLMQARMNQDMPLHTNCIGGIHTEHEGLGMQTHPTPQEPLKDHAEGNVLYISKEE
jgi:hypothetical protein